MTIPAPTYDVATSTLTYNRINDGDVISDSSRTAQNFITAIETSNTDSNILLKDYNIANLSTGILLRLVRKLYM